MSLVVERFLICNKCGKNYGVDNRQWTAKVLRDHAKNDGWVNYSKRDYCPDCRIQPKISPEKI